MIGNTINFLNRENKNEDVLTGKVEDIILITTRVSLSYASEPSTHYLVVGTDGFIYMVYPTDIMDINP